MSPMPSETNVEATRADREAAVRAVYGTSADRPPIAWMRRWIESGDGATGAEAMLRNIAAAIATAARQARTEAIEAAAMVAAHHDARVVARAIRALAANGA